jgi:hypothetical protein
MAPIGLSLDWSVGVFFGCIFAPHSCNLKAVQDLLKKYEKESSKK